MRLLVQRLAAVPRGRLQLVDLRRHVEEALRAQEEAVRRALVGRARSDRYSCRPLSDGRVANIMLRLPPSGLKPHDDAIASSSVDLPDPFSPTRKVTGDGGGVRRACARPAARTGTRRTSAPAALQSDALEVEGQFSMAIARDLARGRTVVRGPGRAIDARWESDAAIAPSRPERMNSPLEIHEVRLRGLHRDLFSEVASSGRPVIADRF